MSIRRMRVVGCGVNAKFDKMHTEGRWVYLDPALIYMPVS